MLVAREQAKEEEEKSEGNGGDDAEVVENVVQHDAQLRVTQFQSIRIIQYSLPDGLALIEFCIAVAL